MDTCQQLGTDAAATPQQVALLAVDWGTSSFRMLALAASGRVLDSYVSQAGVATLGSSELVPYLHTTLAQRFPALRGLPLLLCGMVGSAMGVAEVPYLQCPLAPDALASALYPVERDRLRARIVPGLRCHNVSDTPDFMRGEETQVVGWLARAAARDTAGATLCLPGTHSKWVRIEDGLIQQFSTSMTGELYACLSAHSILVRGAQCADDGAFRRGVKDSQHGLSSRLFTARALVLAGELPSQSAQSYLSGLLIGAEIRERGPQYDKAGPVHVIGTPALCALYQRAMNLLDMPCQTHDGSLLAAAGLAELCRLAAAPGRADP